MPGGFAVVGFDFAAIADDQFRVVAIREASVERVGAGFSVRGVGEAAFKGDGAGFGEEFRAAYGFQGFVDDFFGVLRGRG